MNTSLESLKKLCDDIEVAVNTFNTFSRMIESHMNDFITSQIWEKTNEERKLITTGEQQECFIRFHRCCYQYAPGDRHHRYCRSNEKEVDACQNKKKMNTFLSAKKEHEVKRLSKVLVSMAEDRDSTKIVDFGSGKGYLGQHITSTYAYDVLGIEMNFGCTSSADKRKEQLDNLHQHNSHDRYKTINYAIDSDVVTQSGCFMDLVKENMPNCTSQDHLILTGLHACGGLTSSALKIFCQEESFKGLCIVGCCYNLIGETEFPMSQTVKDFKINLDKSAKMLACQCPTKWDCTDQVLNKSLLHRAILQKILHDKEIGSDDIKNIRFRRLGKKELTFENYMENVRRECEKLDGCLSIDEQNVYYQTYNDIWPRMKEFHWLRMQLGPVIESIIIMDRLAFLLEAGFEDTAAIRIFDQTISPRCFAIVCTRQ